MVVAHRKAKPPLNLSNSFPTKWNRRQFGYMGELYHIFSDLAIPRSVDSSSIARRFSPCHFSQFRLLNDSNRPDRLG